MKWNMKNPNHFGTVTKLKGNRRNPFIVKEGNSGLQKVIGYAASREAGLIMLANYNSDPWDIDKSNITLQQLFDLWKEKRCLKLNKSNQASLRSAYNHCISYSKFKYRNIKSYHMQDTIDSCKCSYATKGHIKSLWSHLDKFAMELDIINKCYSSLITSESIPETNKIPFTDTEVNLLWENNKLPWVSSALFLLYTGFRISEMLELKISDIDLTNNTMIGGTKTDAGKNRIVPIHSKILNIVQIQIQNSKSGYLFEWRGKRILISTYRIYWNLLMKQLNMDHTPHEARHTFRSRLDSAGANKVCIDRLMGHKSEGTGERVYTHKNIDELKMNIELITN